METDVHRPAIKRSASWDDELAHRAKGRTVEIEDDHRRSALKSRSFTRPRERIMKEKMERTRLPPLNVEYKIDRGHPSIGQKRTITHDDEDEPIAKRAMMEIKKEIKKEAPWDDEPRQTRRAPAVTRDDVRTWLAAQRTYTLYRPLKRRFKRLRTVPTGFNTDWQADLNVLTKLKDDNDGYRYLLVCVDVLSRKMFAEPVLKKDAAHMRAAFDAIFERAGTRPWRLYTDSGPEFESTAMRRYFDSKDILKYHSSPQRALHATVAERANRTIKDRLYKYFSEYNTRRWTNAIQNIVDAINRSVCRVTRMRPVDVTEQNAPRLRAAIYGDPFEREERPPPARPRFSVGDHVRVQENKLAFAKFLNTFTDKIFVVTAVERKQDLYVYRLNDGLGRQLPGRFYEHDLVKTVPAPQTTTRVATIIGRPRVRDGRRQESNRTSEFTVRLPRKLEFNTPWRVGLTNIIYPYSWPNIGTDGSQYMDVEWRDGSVTRVKVPSKSYRSVQDLTKAIKEAFEGWERNICVIRAPKRSLDVPSEDADGSKRTKRDAHDGSVEEQQQEESETEEDEFADWGGISLTDNEKDLIRDLRDQRKELRVRLRRIWALEEEVEKKKARIKELELENDELPTLRERLASVEEKRKTDVVAANEVIGQRQTKISELNERITQLESGAQGAEDELRKTNEQRQNYARDVSRLTAEKQQLERDKQKEIDALTSRIEALEATEKELQTARDDVDELQIRQKALRGELDAANAESARLGVELQTVRAERIAAESRAQSLQARVNELQRESTTLKSTEEERREELAKELRDAREKLTRTENELLANATQVYSLTAQVSELTKSIAFAESAHDAAGPPIDVAEDQAICVANADVARYRTIASHIVLLYDESKGRARLRFDPATMRAVRLSRQLQYVLGFEEHTLTEAVSYAKYMPDLHGGVHSLCVYAPGLIEPVMVGDSVAPLLRIAKVKGSPGDMVEDTFLSPQYHKVLEKTLTEISIHIRTATGRLVPFNWARRAHMHINFDPETVDWGEFVTVQTGGGAYFTGFPYQRGSGAYFAGFPYQRGAGIGTVFGTIFRFLLPLIKSAGREIGREGLATGARILGNLAEGKATRHAVVEETAEGLKNLINRSDPQAALRTLVDKAQARLQQQRGSGRKRGTTLTLKPQRAKGRSVKRKRLDQLGFY
ncbi:hypothetical protein AAVH_05856 [Aphelenchoides avenae]|nr:hypothetical protein AAVH_05856 [Aphelenchus avenae]